MPLFPGPAPRIRTYHMPRPFFLTALAIVLATCSVTALPVWAESSPEELDRLTLQWGEIERQRSRLESQWIKRKAVLNQQVSLLEIEHTALKDALAKDQSERGEVKEKRTELLELQIRFEQEQAQLEKSLAENFLAIEDLQYRLPPPLQQSWQQAMDEIPEETQDNSRRLELLLRLLAQLEDFENRIALHDTVMTFDDVEIQVQQFYLGLSQGWYVDKSGHHAGYGFSTVEGWKWVAHTQIRGLKPDVLLTVVAMLQNRSRAELVALPVQLQRQDLSLEAAVP